MPEAEKDGPTSFWKTLPGILTGGAALLTAVGGLVVVVMQVFGAPGPVAAPPAAVTTAPPAVASTSIPQGEISSPGSAGEPTSESPAGPSSAASSPAEVGVLYEDRLEMKTAEFADLETGKIGNPPPNDDFYLHGTDVLASYGASPASGAFTKVTCEKALSDRSYNTVHLTEVGDDQWLCIQTKEGNLGGMKIIQLPKPGSPIVILEYVLWT